MQRREISARNLDPTLSAVPRISFARKLPIRLNEFVSMLVYTFFMRREIKFAGRNQLLRLPGKMSREEKRREILTLIPRQTGDS